MKTFCEAAFLTGNAFFIPLLLSWKRGVKYVKNKYFPLKQNLTCANYGLYVATCVICHEQYVGQSINKSSTKWASHWGAWR